MPEGKTKKLSAHPKAIQIMIDCIKNGLSDSDIQKRLTVECGYKWTIGAINKRRHALAISKNQTTQINAEIVDSPVLGIPRAGLNELEKAAWFRSQFKKTHLFQTIKRQFEPEEVAVYLEDFGLLCCQFEDIVISEFMQIDDFLKHRILVDRQLILARALQRQITDLQTWFIDNPRTEEESKELTKFRMLQQHMLDERYKHLSEANERYDALVRERQKIYISLAATRKDRLDELRGGKETFLDLVAKLQHSHEEREKSGQLAELTKIAAEDVKSKFRCPVEFPDGSIEPILLDSETEFGDA